MKRLPMETLESIIGIQKTTLEAFEKHGSEDSDYCPAYDKAVLMLLEELKQYRIAEEQGLLLRLPCKVGDTVYTKCAWGIESGVVGSIEIIGDMIFVNNPYRAMIGQAHNIFLTKEEAEQALERMEGEHE